MKFFKHTLFFVGLGATLSSCEKLWPTEKEAFSLDMNYNLKSFSPYTERVTSYENIFSAPNTTLPLTFRISDVRTYDGSRAPELLKLYPVKVWTEMYTGWERSVEEIEAKRTASNRPILEIGEHSGNVIFWNSSTDYNVKIAPDSGYYFNVEVSSEGGRKYIKDLVLRPNPAEAYTPYAKNAESVPVSSIDILGAETGRSMNVADVNVWLHRVGDGNTLSFKFFAPDLTPIPLDKFNETDWDNLVHGFNKRYNDDRTMITYDVVYPVPLVRTIPTPYTTASGDLAHVEFKFNRLGLGNRYSLHSIAFDFGIFKEGAWEVIFYFKNEAPSFALN